MNWRLEIRGKKHFSQRGVWRQAGRCLVGHFAGILEFASRPSLTDTPACPKLLKRCRQCRVTT